MKEKDLLRERFSREPQKYYEVELFRSKGFQRRRCPLCGKYFWTLDEGRETCPDQPCQQYEFLGNPPTSKRLDYRDTWRTIEDFFVRHGHTSVKRYPVVCRWRPDLFFTVASIIDFQRIEGGKVVFELPANPLIVPQMCLRFNDIPNVGLSGKHYTSFCMIGQHSITNSEGYWKDRCVELDYELLVGPFGIEPKEISFVEDVWLGYGAFGYSLEYFVRGLELGNAVFTAFEGTPQNYREIRNKVIDMGAGLERFVWITQGTPTSYDAVFGPVVKAMMERCGLEYDYDFFLKYGKVAGALNLDEVSDLSTIRRGLAKSLGMAPQELSKKTAPFEALYALADHTRSLVFAIADGGLPSNVGGGYNLRVILRRALALLDRFRWNLKIEEIALWHIDYLKELYPELDEHRDDVVKILNVEEKRYRQTRMRTSRIVEDLKKSGRAIGLNDLVRLYDSDGITPELLKEQGLMIDIPEDFYTKVTELHVTQKEVEEKPIFDVDDLPATRRLYYEDQELYSFQARVLKIFEDRYMVLDKTAFYPRSGGQEPDKGWIEDVKVLDVDKYGDVIVHRLEKCKFHAGDMVSCEVDSDRRNILRRHHTATHIVNGAARKVLGSWVWQHSAYKDVKGARLDITHFAHLSREEVQKIEGLANEVVRRNLPVEIKFLPRGEAERLYGFRLYQGGVVPEQKIRVVDIVGWDAEACGGIHCSRTGDVGLIKILRTERVQDGVERIEFVAGEPAISEIQRQESILIKISQLLGAQQKKILEAVTNLKLDSESRERQLKALIRKAIPPLIEEIRKKSADIKGLKVYINPEDDLGEDFHISIGEQSIEADPSLIYCGFSVADSKVRIFVFSGAEAQKMNVKAGDLVRMLANLVGGSGGGNTRFGQGGGNLVNKVREAKMKTPPLVDKMVGDVE